MEYPYKIYKIIIRENQLDVQILLDVSLLTFQPFQANIIKITEKI